MREHDNAEIEESHDGTNPEARKDGPNSHYKSDTTDYSMLKLINSMQRLLDVAEDDPILYERLCRGETEGVDGQLVEDMERVKETIAE